MAAFTIQNDIDWLLGLGEKLREAEQTPLQKLFDLFLGGKPLNNVDAAPAAPPPAPTPPATSSDKFFLVINRELAETLLAVTANVNPGNEKADALMKVMDQLAEAMRLDDDDLARIYRKAKIEIQNPEDLLSGITIL